MNDVKQTIREQLKLLSKPDDVFKLFRILNYPDTILFDKSSKRKKDTFDFKKEDSRK